MDDPAANNDNDTSISSDEVARIAKLALLRLDTDAATAMRRDLNAILHYVHKLDELDTRDVTPTLQPNHPQGNLRNDTIAPGLSTDAALDAAPARLVDGYGVPRML